MTRTAPQFPVYVPSKGRATIALTPRTLSLLGVSCRLIVEEQQWPVYRDVYGADRLLVLPRSYQDSYDTIDDLGDTRGKGPGPARNFAWDHSVSEGHAWHWVMDDNISFFGRLNNNVRQRVGDGLIFTAMEDFCLRYVNVGMAGPEYYMFLPSRQKQAQPFKLNRRVFSCNLIRNDTGLRWRGRYNEDLILSLDMVTHGWCTVTFLAFLQNKMRTQVMRGGNTEEFYAREGTLPKSRLAVRAYPDVVRLVTQYGRPHHYVDWSQFRSLRLIRRPDYQPPPVNPYQTRITGPSGPPKQRRRPVMHRVK